jgi:hypothetical protein
MSAFASAKPVPGPGPTKIEHKIDQLLVTVSLNIEGQSELELTSDLFSQEAPPGFKTEKYPFVSGNSKIDESTLSSKLYPDILKTFFVRDTFRTFIKEHGETPTGIEMDPGILEHNIMLMLRYLFDTYPTVNNVTDSLTQKLPITLIEKTHQYTYLNIGSDVYTVARVVLINDIYNHELYIKFANDFSAFESWKTSEVQTITKDYNKQNMLIHDIIAKFKGDPGIKKELDSDIGKIKTYLANRTNWTGLGNNAVVRNALTVLKLHLEHINKISSIPKPILLGGADTTIKLTKSNLNGIHSKITTLIKNITKLESSIKDIATTPATKIMPLRTARTSSNILKSALENVINTEDLTFDINLPITLKVHVLSPPTKRTRPTTKRTHKTTKSSDKSIPGGADGTVQIILGTVSELMGAIDDNVPDDASSPIKKRFETIQGKIGKITTQIDTETNSLIANLNELFKWNELDTANQPAVTKNLVEIKAYLTALSVEFTDTTGKDDIFKLIGDLKKSEKTSTRNDTQNDEKAIEDNEREIEKKLLSVSILTPDFLSELNRTYKIITDNNTLALSVSIRTFIKDITEKNDITVKQLELLKYFRDTDMFKDYKKIDYDNADYKSLIDTVFAGKKVISKMINHSINKGNPELLEDDLVALVSKINGRVKGAEFNVSDDRTGISYDSTIVGKPRIETRVFIDCVEGKVDDTNKHLIDMCSFRDKLLLDELEQLMAEKAEMLLHDPLMQLSKPNEVITVGGTYRTCKRRGRRNRTRKKKRV